MDRKKQATDIKSTHVHLHMDIFVHEHLHIFSPVYSLNVSFFFFNIKKICTQIISIFEIVAYVLWGSSWASWSGNVTNFYFSFSKLTIFQFSTKRRNIFDNCFYFSFSKTCFKNEKKKIMGRHAGKKMIIKQISNYKKTEIYLD